MIDTLLILNAGSSSLKFSVFRDDEPPELLLGGQLEALQTEPRFLVRDATGKTVHQQTWPAATSLTHHAAIEFLLNWLRQEKSTEFRIVAAGHRVVHGGTRFAKPVLIDEDVLTELQNLVPLAPLHQPHNVAAMQAVTRQAAALPQVACFDTAFHRTQPDVARHFALPADLTAAGVQRYGFHGLSYEYVTATLARTEPAVAAGKIVIAHLGNGASLCAVQNGISIATTMGFTPLDGLVMGTRCGSIDPGVLIYLIDQYHLDARGLEQLLYHKSGLLGVSGLSSDMRTLLDAEAVNPRAAEAIQLFVYRIAREVGSLAAALGGLDALVFTGGIGEHSAVIRSRICQATQWLGLRLDEARNDRGSSRISRPNSHVSAWVIPTNEELMIAEHTHRLLQTRGQTSNDTSQQ